jgi:transcriptional regulator with XRE-family HTH domain
MGIKQQTLSKDMGVAQPTVSDWESGKMNPSIDNLIALSRYFNVTVGCIVGTEPVPEGYPDHLAPVQYNEVIHQEQRAAEPVRVFKPTKKPPFSRDQLDYLDEWGKSLKTDVAEEVVERLREVSSLLRETGDA